MARNIQNIRLTETQEKFIAEVIRGRKPEDAARAAGFADSTSDAAARLLKMPAVAAAIRFEVTRLLTVEALPLAYRVLKEIAQDETAPAAVRRACAVDLMSRAGFVAPKATDAPDADAKPLSEMSSEELRGLVDRLESELAGRAVDVSAPDSAPPSAKRLEFLD